MISRFDIIKTFTRKTWSYIAPSWWDPIYRGGTFVYFIGRSDTPADPDLKQGLIGAEEARVKKRAEWHIITERKNHDYYTFYYVKFKRKNEAMEFKLTWM